VLTFLGIYFLVALLVGAYHAYIKAEYMDTALGKGVLWGLVVGRWLAKKAR
jgi:hypothetical protein